MTTPHDKALEAFTEYFVKNYPGPDTVIFDPKWHAPRIFRAALHSILLHDGTPLPIAGKGDEGWRPIETAPKDGTVIQAWHTVHKCPMSVLWKEKGFPFNGSVLNWYEKSYTTAWPDGAFSHFRPLPAPPSLLSEDTEGGV